MDVKEILRHVDHTLLLQPSTWAEIRQICDDAVKYGTASVCIPPCYVKEAAESTSPIIAIRLRSRPVIWRMGSTPACFKWMHRPKEDAFRQADCISVTFTPWTLPWSRAAASNCSWKL